MGETSDSSRVRAARAARSTSACEPKRAEPAFRPVASLAFWLCLLLAASLFASTFLAPKLRTYRELSRQYDRVQRTLVAAERRVDKLQSVADALEHDPDFAAELARVDFNASGPEERIPVDPRLKLQKRPDLSDPDRSEAAAIEGATAAANLPRVQNLLESPLVDTIAADRAVRISLLAGAVVLVLIAFTVLCDQSPGGAAKKSRAAPGWPRRLRDWLIGRYASPPSAHST